MNKKNKLHLATSGWMIEGLILVAFLMVITALVLPAWRSNQLLIANDWSFHASRVEEIYQNLKGGHFFTAIATHTFHRTGVANFLFYPTLFLYPWAAFRFFLSPSSAFYLWYSLISLATFEISYHCAKKVTKTTFSAFVAAICYGLMPYHLFTGRGVFGEFIAMTFLPVVLLGAYQLFFEDERKWMLLSIGMALVCYSHVLSVLMVSEVVALLLVVSLIVNRGMTLARLKRLGYAIALALLLMVGQVAPFFTDYIGKGIFSTNAGLIYQQISSPKHAIADAFNLTVGQSLGFILAMALFLGLVTIAMHNRQALVLWLLGALLFIATTSAFPWQLIGKTPLGVIQFPYRYLSYAGIFLALLTGLAAEKLFTDPLQVPWQRGVKYLALLILATSYAVISQVDGGSWGWWNNNQMALPAPKKGAPVQPTPTSYKLSNKTHHRMFEYGVLYGEADYYPKAARGVHQDAYFGGVVMDKKTASIINGVAYLNGKKTKLSTTPGANQLTYRLSVKKKTTVNLPFLAYHNSFAKVDGKTVSYQASSRGTIQVNVSKGEHKITVGYHRPVAQKAALVVTLLTWLAIPFLRKRGRQTSFGKA